VSARPATGATRARPAGPRRLAALALASLALASLAGAAHAARPVTPDETLRERAEAAVLLEVVPAAERAVVGQTVPVRVTIGVGTAFLEDHVYSSFRRPLDLPVHARAAWIGPDVGLDVTPGLRRPRARSLALNGEKVHAPPGEDRLVGGRAFTTVVLEPLVRADVPGPLELAPVTVTLFYASAFTDDVLRGRVPADRHELSVSSHPLVIEVAPLPRAGRPDGFTGAIGTFTLEASARPRELVAGESLALTLVIEGEGDLDAFGAPSLGRLSGFHVYGHVESGSGEARTITYDVAPLHEGVTRVPPIGFAYFDPRAAAYRTAWSAPIPLEVRPRAPVTAAGAQTDDDGPTAAGGAATAGDAPAPESTGGPSPPPAPSFLPDAGDHPDLPGRASWGRTLALVATALAVGLAAGRWLARRARRHARDA